MTHIETADDEAATIVRYAVLRAEENIDNAIKWCPYADDKEAHRVRRRLDKIDPKDAPHRVVELTVMIVENGDV